MFLFFLLIGACFAASEVVPLTSFQVRHEGVDGPLLMQNGPKPSSISLSLQALSKSFDFSGLQLMSHLVSENSVTRLVGKNDEVLEEIPNESTSYWKINEDGTWVSVTFFNKEQTLFHAVIADHNETYQIDPVDVHEPEMSGAQFQELQSASSTGMAVFKLSSAKLEERLCAAVDPLQPDREVQAVPPLPAAQRSLLLTRWTNCYSSSTVKKISVAAVADYSFYKKMGSSITKVNNAILSVFADINVIYYGQVGVYLELHEIWAYNGTNGLRWNQNRGSASRCSYEIGTMLDDFTAWRNTTQKGRFGLWHLFTDCYPLGTGTVGIAWIGALCNQNWGAGVSSYSKDLWLTTAHEIGHNFGAQHTHYLGGLMDYYAEGSKYQGEVQFYSPQNKNEMCTQISSSLSKTASPYCWADFKPTCGNGIVEPGEQCDVSNSCCKNCKLVSECATGQCCDTSTCRFRTTSTSCTFMDGSAGYCANGICTSGCLKYSNLQHGCMKSSNPCWEGCYWNGNTDTCYTDNWSSGDEFLYVKSGTWCTWSGSYRGKCNLVNDAPVCVIWVVSNWSTCSATSCGVTGTQTRSTWCRDASGKTYADSYCTAVGLTRPATSQTCKISGC